MARRAVMWFWPAVKIGVLYFFSQSETIFASPYRPCTLNGGAPFGWIASQPCSAQIAICVS